MIVRWQKNIWSFNLPLTPTGCLLEQVGRILAGTDCSGSHGKWLLNGNGSSNSELSKNDTDVAHYNSTNINQFW